jgi:hypothetical protein
VWAKAAYALGLVQFCVSAGAQWIMYTRSSSGNWDDASKWTPAGVLNTTQEGATIDIDVAAYLNGSYSIGELHMSHGHTRSAAEENTLDLYHSGAGSSWTYGTIGGGGSEAAMRVRENGMDLTSEIGLLLLG